MTGGTRQSAPGPVRLETERLVIRDYAPGDEAEYYQLKSHEGAMQPYMWDIMLHSREKSRKEFAGLLADVKKPERTFYFLRVEEKGTGRQMGSVGYTVEERPPVGKLVHAGYFYFPEFWGKGFGTEAMREVIRFAFEEDGVYRISTGCLKENHGSERIMQKCGMIKEAERPGWTWHEGKMKTRLEYRLLKEEYSRDKKEERTMFAIAIDGPAGAGKSSAARAVAKTLGFTYVDTGALYRTIALYMLENHIDLENPAALTAALPGVEVSLEYGPEGQRTLLGGRDVSEAIRTEEVSAATSRWVAHVPEVRAFLLDLQRELAAKNDVVMDGRDIGTVILPHAQLKVFLTASAEERARRRTLQLEQAGEPADYDQVLEEVIRRDRQDAPQLEQLPPDGVTLDTTGLDFGQVVERLTGMARERMG